VNDKERRKQVPASFSMQQASSINEKKKASDLVRRRK